MSRIQSVEVFRVFAIIAVISIHTAPFGGIGDNQIYTFLNIAINQGSRFAVPFFFIMSGFFFAKKINGGGAVFSTMVGALKRLLAIWLFFSIVYIFPYDLIAAFEYGSLGPFKVIYWNLLSIKNDLMQFVFQGTKVHLWFLVSLAWAIIITSFFLRCFQSNPLPPLIVFSMAIYVVGMLAKSYADTPLGISIDFDTRHGPFFGTVFFVMGYVLSRLKLNANCFFYGLIITFLGYALHLGEVYYLFISYEVWPTIHEYVVGTLLVGLGVSLMALSNHPFLNIKSISGVGRYTLGIYGIHFVFIDLLAHYDKKISSPVWEIGYVFIVFLLSVGITLMLSKSKRLKKVLV